MMINRHRKTQAPSMTTRLFQSLAGLALMTSAAGCSPNDQTPNDGGGVKLTWFSIGNWGLETSDVNIVIDGYMTRIPADYFAGGGGQLGLTKKGYPIDTAAVDKMLGLLAAKQPVKYLLTGHSHFDHSFDTPYWAKKTGAKIIGSPTTCFQVQALGVPKEQCTPVHGGESFQLSPTVSMWVVLWNHSGTHEGNPEQHDPVELTAPPMPDPSGNLRAGVAEDFPNGGGNRGFLFKIQTPSRVLSLFWTNSGSAVDLQLDTVINGTNYGSPLQSLAKAMSSAGLTSVDLWIAGGVEPVARYVIPILHPAVFIPNHLGDFFQWFDRGYDNGPFMDPVLSKYLSSVKVQLLPPVQFLDRFDLTPSSGVVAVPNPIQKSAYGFPEKPDYREAGVGPMASDAAADSTAGGSPEASGEPETGTVDVVPDNMGGDGALDVTSVDVSALDAPAVDAPAPDATHD
jgi:hypothetical protein